MTFTNWLVVIGLVCAITSVNFFMMAMVVSKLVDEVEKVKCRLDITRGLLMNIQMNWTAPMLRMSALTHFIQEFIGRLEEESSIHSRIPKVFNPSFQDDPESLFGPNQQVEVERLEELYGSGPEEGPNG